MSALQYKSIPFKFLCYLAEKFKFPYVRNTSEEKRLELLEKLYQHALETNKLSKLVPV
jgi:hypothetical protein